MIDTIKDLTVIVLLIGIMIYIYVLVGMELFAYRLPFDPNLPSNFNGLLNSFLTVFIVFAEDGWSQIYLKCYQYTNPILTSLYFFSLLGIGHYLMINLLIAIIIENFEYLSVKNDLINKINNMKSDEELQNMSFKQRIERAMCFWRKKPLKVNHKNEDEE